MEILPITYKILSHILLSRLTPYAEENLGFINAYFDEITQLVVVYFTVVKYFRKKWEYNKAVRQKLIDFKKAYDSVRKEKLCKILIEFGIPMKLVRLIEMCLKETCSTVRNI